MGRIFSIHEYDLRSDVEGADFERELRQGGAGGILQIPGLVSHQFGRGVKGARLGGHAALWIYESRDAWERLWGPPERPLPPEAYPPDWRRWEEILSPFLAVPAHTVRFTAYEEIESMSPADLARPHFGRRTPEKAE